MLHAALDVCGSALMVVDPQGKVVAANSIAASLCGIERGATLPPAWMQADSPVLQALAGRMPRRVTSLPTPAGTHVQLSAAPVKEPGLGGLVAVTARVLPEMSDGHDKLRRERDWAWSIIEAVGTPIVVLNREGRIISFNSACEAVTGYTAAELRGRTLWEHLIPPEEVEEVRAVFQNLRAGRFPNRHENYWVAKNGTRRLLSWSNTALVDDSGAVEYVIGTGVDITEQRRWEQELRQANETLNAVINTGPLAIIALDMEARVIKWNLTAEQIFGWREEEVLGQALPAVPAEDLGFFHGCLERVHRGETLTALDRRGKRKDGTPVDIAIWHGPRRNAAGEVVGTVCVIADVTERKRLEEQFLHAQRMEAVGRLAGGVAHDFNNLLTVITGYSQMVVDSMNAADPLRGFVEEVLRASESAAALTSQLLAFSRRQVVQPQVLDLNTLVAGMEKMVHRLIGEDVEFVTLLSPHVPKVKADPGQLQQVIMNLVVNARDAMPDGGRLTIKTSTADAPQSDTPPDLASGRYAVLSVVDTGKGMDEETRRRIFEPFFTTKPRHKGTGLGLSTAYGIVKQSGGELWATTELGKGSQFRIYLPAIEEDVEAAAPQVAVPSTWRGTETVLLVEDEAGLRKLIREVLRAKGFFVLQAGDGNEALRICEQHLGAIHLFLTDIVMPCMSGRELAQRATALRPGMKVLYMSGYTEIIAGQPEVIERDTPFLRKPFTPDELLCKVRAVLDAE
ncbi:MAG: PAS domain S-box protein [Rhodospirillales bacterium]